MGFKHFNRILFFRLTMLVIAAAVLGWLLFKELYPWALLLLCIVVILFIMVVTHVNKTNKQIAFFISSVRNDDTSLRFPEKTGNKIINELHQSLNELNLILQDLKLRNQIKEQYFSEIIRNIGIGVIILNDKGFITEVNPSALDIFGMHTLTHTAQFDRIDHDFREQLEKALNPKQLLTLRRGGEITQLVVRCSVIRLKNEKVRLITLQDIRGELERKEIDSWVKLIRVLSHEIMNSLTPVTSISQSLKGMWEEKTGIGKVDADIIESTIDGLEVIGDRGEALIRFVKSYRVLTKVPEPRIELHSIDSLMSSLSILLSPYKEAGKVAIQFVRPENDFDIGIDMQMITQVIINLVKNAVEASSSEIEISATKIADQAKIKVQDNGEGILPEVIDNVFVPFFTTKENGSGIGLSHSRQIVRAHGGMLKCESQPGCTAFSILI